jgi:hypothetical protein
VSEGRVQTFLAVLGAGLLAQGALSLLLDATGLASSQLPQRLADSDPLHAATHVIWGAGMLVLVRRGLPDSAAAQLALAFGAFYTGLAIAGLTVHHPLGMRLDRGENVFHLIVGPASLAVGLAASLRLRAGTA